MNACNTATLGGILAGGLPTGYTVANGAVTTFASNGAANDCLIIPPGTNGANTGTATATVIAVIN